MGHRTCKRVPLEFAWPLNKVWGGYVQPAQLEELPCPSCNADRNSGAGYSPRAQELYALWYGHAPFYPSDTGSSPFTVESPGVRAHAERNIAAAPEYYGSGELAVVREASRLADLWNSMWSHHLAQEDVDALVEAGRLWDFTRRWVPGEGWQDDDSLPHPTAAEINAWSIEGFGHDSLNAHYVIEARCEREGVESTCQTCQGHGSIEAYPGQRAEADAWEWVEPPEGPGWQLWETVSEGSPVSPVFATAEELAEWCAPNATWFASEKWTVDQWLTSFINDTTDVDSLLIVGHPG